MRGVPERLRYLLRDEAKAFMSLVTLMPDGSPQVTPVWFNHDGEHILINSARGRVKDRNMKARPRVAALIMDPGNPYSYLQIRGWVIEIIEEGADDHIRDLNMKYLGDRNFNIGSDTRVIYKIAII